jgi:ParB-like chromosome segregation protein Spo0J
MKSKGVFEVPVAKIEVIQGLLPRIYTHTIEEKVQEYQEAMAEGQEFPPITVWDKDGHYWLIDGMHRLLASKRLGKETIKAEVVELENELEARILAIEKNASHGIPLDKEEKRELARLLYADGVEIEKLRKLFRVSERTVYNWVEGVKRRAKDEELKRQALELRRQGLTQEEVAKRLGVGRQTISDWERESLPKPAKIADSSIANNSQLLAPDGTPTQEGYKTLSEFIEENEEELRQKPFNDVVKEPALRDVLKFLHEAIKKDLKRFIDAPTYEKVKNYLITIYPYKELSLKARKIFFDKALSLWEKMKKEHEEEIKLEREVLEEAKRILANPEYVFHTWRTLREDLARLGDMNHTFVYAKKEEIEDILHRHADELMEIYKKVPEATYTALSDEELEEIKEKVKNEDKWGRLTRIREEVEQKLKEKRLRPVNAVVEELVKRVEELLKEETKPIIDWAKIEQIAEEIEKNTPEEVWEEIRKEYEKQTQEQKKAKEKEKKTLPPSIEEYYKKQLELLLLDMGIKIGWVKAFEIVDEIYEKVKEFSKKAVRGW